MNNYLETAIDRLGGQKVLAQRIGVSRQAIAKWVRGKVPPTRVLTVERETGISRHVLRPDIYPLDQ